MDKDPDSVKDGCPADAEEKKEHYGFRLADVSDPRARKAYERWGGGRRKLKVVKFSCFLQMHRVESLTLRAVDGDAP